MDKLSAHAFRLKPGEDLKTGIQKLVTKSKLKQDG